MIVERLMAYQSKISAEMLFSEHVPFHVWQPVVTGSFRTVGRGSIS